MYEPVFNSVLVEIDDAEAEWGSGNDESMMGKSYSKGKAIRFGDFVDIDKYPDIDDGIYDDLLTLAGKNIIWNEGAEAGTTFVFDGKLFGFIYWYDVRGAKVND